MEDKHLVTILGSTGTIGQNTLDVVRRNSEKFSIFALCAHSNYQRLFLDCLEFQPRYAVLNDSLATEALQALLKKSNINTEVLKGQEAAISCACDSNVHSVMAATVGAAGLIPVMAAAKAGKRILLANKETLVMAGSLFIQTVQEGGAELLPIDSEHNAIFQVIPKSNLSNTMVKGVKKIILTASGGPFRHLSAEQLRDVTVDQALAHPNWVMGKKITIDSATMMNKGLEVIEAHWLFGASPEQIDVVIHPQSIIHSMVEYIDGSTLAQMGNPDMRTPISYALSYPERMESGARSLNLCELGTLQFEAPDLKRFPCLGLAYDALRIGGTAPAIINAANEVAVGMFLEESISFIQIPQLIEHVLNSITIEELQSIEQLLSVDEHARAVAASWRGSSRC